MISERQTGKISMNILKVQNITKPTSEEKHEDCASFSGNANCPGSVPVCLLTRPRKEYG